MQCDGAACAGGRDDGAGLLTGPGRGVGFSQHWACPPPRLIPASMHSWNVFLGCGVWRVCEKRQSSANSVKDRTRVGVESCSVFL